MAVPKAYTAMNMSAQRRHRLPITRASISPAGGGRRCEVEVKCQVRYVRRGEVRCSEET